MNRPRIHFHSDCRFFAGCENMLATFFQDPGFRSSYQISFSYRFSQMYEDGLRARVPDLPATFPLALADAGAWAQSWDRPWMRTFARVLAAVTAAKYWCVLVNTVVLTRLFRRLRPDVVHINNGGYPGAYSCAAAALSARLAGVPNVIYVVNSIAYPYRHIRRWLDYPLDRAVRASVTRFVTGSQYAREHLSDVLNLDDAKAVSLANAIRPRPITEDREAVVRRLHLDASRPLLVVVALLESRKGHDVLLRSMARLRKDNANPIPQLIIEGVGPCENDLRSQVHIAGLEEDVIFVGREANVMNLLNAADMVTLPSTGNEDFPNIVLEAMMLGKPVIASRLSGIPEQVEDGVTGILVAPGDDVALGEAIAQLASSKSLIASMGTLGKERFERLFRADVGVRGYQHLYRSLLEEKE